MMNMANGKKEKKQEFTKEELEKALLYAQWVFEGAICIFFPMGKTAYSIRNNEWLKGDKITLGVRKRDLAESTVGMLKSINPNIDISEKKIIMEHEGVPIEIRIIHKHYRTLDQLDQTFYAYEMFYLPNPFNEFWRMTSFMH